MFNWYLGLRHGVEGVTPNTPLRHMVGTDNNFAIHIFKDKQYFDPTIYYPLSSSVLVSST